MAKKRANGEAIFESARMGDGKGDIPLDTMKKTVNESSRAFSARHRQK